MKKIYMSPEREVEIPTKEPETIPNPAEPTQNPSKEDDPWTVPTPLISPQPKA